MPKSLYVPSTLVLLVFAILYWLGDFNGGLAHAGAFQTPHNAFNQPADDHRIKGIEILLEGSGVLFTSKQMFRTDDSGASWREMPLPLKPDDVVAGFNFTSSVTGFVVAGNLSDKNLAVLKTTDGGSSWMRIGIPLRDADRAESQFEKVELTAEGTKLELSLRLASSSNFNHTSTYTSDDGGINWRHLESDNKIVSDAEEALSGGTGPTEMRTLGLSKGEDVLAEANSRRSRWVLTNEGVCEDFKSTCIQVSRVHDVSNGFAREITPVQILEATDRARQNTRFEEMTSSLLPPGGSTRISLNRGFDKCTAATSAQMQTWWNSSPYYDANIYISGRNRGCTQPQLTATWVNAVSNQGWGLIPTIVGYQSPCSSCTSCAKHSSDTSQAELDGRGEADIAITDANNLGLLQGTVLYYDMEIYDTANTGSCSASTKAFLKGWTDRVKERGYISGVYGSPTNAMRDWVNITAASQPQAVWWARWDNIMSVWNFAGLPVTVPENVWNNHQRIKQYQAPANATYGGVTFNIDGNIADGPVAGVQPKNRRSDFDGDGKSDIAVWRPDSGVWYMLNSSDSVFRAIGFGVATDIPTPGDFDGDGRTDQSVWRPENGVWHFYSRSIYTSYQFGLVGDIPVPADYDGDGRTDIAVYRPSNGMWYIRNSFDSKGASFRFEQFGISEDTPIPGDFDGDGKADLAVFRPSNGVWYLMGSTAGFSATQFGISTDQPVSADFDGDGKNDRAVYRAGTWYILGSQAGFYGFGFGFADDKPAPGDFDGDGKADVAVFRPSTGIWYVLGSAQGFSAVQFGISTDKPVPTAYMPKS